ncbi:MAG: hypothetical protein ACRDSE_06280 [Pseudonocardiaceae bacterium]
MYLENQPLCDRQRLDQLKTAVGRRDVSLHLGNVLGWRLDFIRARLGLENLGQ